MVVIENIFDYFIYCSLLLKTKFPSLKKIMVDLSEEIIYFIYKMLIKLQSNSSNSYLLNSEDKERRSRHSSKNKFV